MVWDVFQQLEVAVKVSAMLFSVIFAAYFWDRGRRAELTSTRRIFLGQGLFAFCFGMTRVLFLLSDFYNAASPLLIFPNEYLATLFWKLSTLIGILAIVFLLLVIETYLVKSRYVLSVVASAGLIIALVSQDINFARIVTYITLPIAMVGVIFLYAYLFFKESGAIRKKAALSLDGFIIFAIGVFLDTNLGKTLFPTLPGFIPMVILIIGLAIYTYFNVKEEFTS